MAKVIMVMGTTSDAGKTLITAGLCRIFKQDGYKAAPFKSQNMSLNSYITDEGLEMARGQAMQAEAAGIKPSVLMNPVLLKPVHDICSQVIVLGEVVGTMTAAEYNSYKKELLPRIKASYDELARDYDVIVIEGAGSPAEINLRQDDIVNMGMAQLVDAPVVLVADIDRGGVFASLYGTVALLTKAEQQRIKGMIINKFRGDIELLRPGLDTIEAMIKKPVLGVVPYLDLDLDDEDSLSHRLSDKQTPGLVDIAVIRLPHISNFTDFNSLERMEGVSLRYVKAMQQLGQPDLIILPGTKNTMGDLLWLRQKGFEAAILQHAAGGGALIGICGGYQMLGMSLSDPQGIEQGGRLKGLGLLPAETVFRHQKTRTQVQGVFDKPQGIFASLKGCAWQGYEIHMGCTGLIAESANEPGQGAPRLSETKPVPLNNGTDHTGRIFAEGLALGNIMGTYVHGIFDSEECALGLINALLQAKGLQGRVSHTDWSKYKERQYDALAAGLRQSLDMHKMYEILEGRH